MPSLTKLISDTLTFLKEESIPPLSFPGFVAILAAASTEEEESLLYNLAAAISKQLRFAKVVTDVPLGARYVLSTQELMLAPHQTLIHLLPLSTYLTNAEEKKKLWNLLCQTLRH